MHGAKNSEFFRYGASQGINSTMGAGTVQTVVSAAANTNGMLVHDAGYYSVATGGGQLSLLAKTSAPTNIVDGDVVMGTGLTSGNVGSGSRSGGRSVYIPAGKGLYFYCLNSETAGHRWALYTLL